MAEQQFNWRPTLRKRLAVAAALLLVWTAGIQARLLYLQIGQHDEMVSRAERQQMRTIEAPAKRGEIRDRNGRMLAFSVDAETIYAVPTEVEDAAHTAAALCGALDRCTDKEQQSIRERLSQRRAFVYVKRRVTPDEARRVAGLDLEGVGFVKESRRFYPNKELGSHLLGYVGLDNVGLSGLEAAYDKVIRGRAGTVLIQTDARRRAFSRIERTPTSGGSLELTIDEQLQYIVERELRIGVEDNRADAGSAVVMDPYTGEILAMANYPTFNPNAYNTASSDQRRNRAVQDLYEPGSTFKVVTASAALEEGVIRPGDPIDVSAGSIRLGSSTVRDMHRYGVLSFTDVMVKSSNVGAIKVGLKLGPERLGLYVSRFGFGRASSPDFPGENPGIVYNPARLNDRALGSVSMGYQVGVTPLQMAAAVSSVANGGRLIVPRVVRAMVRDGARTRVEPKVVRQTINATTVAELTAIMEAVVERGTATRAKVEGFTVAGKTGTAEKLVNGRYSNSDHQASFVGFVPSRNPVFTIIVVLDTPRAHGNTGGVTAAPIFQKIASAALRQMGVPPTINPQPPVLVARTADTSSIANTASAARPAIVTLAASQSEASLMPDFRGMSARDALRATAKLGLTARIQGNGMVVDQLPPPGSPLEPGTTCSLVLGRELPRTIAGAPGAQQ